MNLATLESIALRLLEQKSNAQLDPLNTVIDLVVELIEHHKAQAATAPAPAPAPQS